MASAGYSEYMTDEDDIYEEDDPEPGIRADEDEPHIMSVYHDSIPQKPASFFRLAVFHMGDERAACTCSACQPLFRQGRICPPAPFAVALSKAEKHFEDGNPQHDCALDALAIYELHATGKSSLGGAGRVELEFDERGVDIAIIRGPDWVPPAESAAVVLFKATCGAFGVAIQQYARAIVLCRAAVYPLRDVA